MKTYESILEDMKEVVLEAAKMLGNRENAASITVISMSSAMLSASLGSFIYCLSFTER